MKVVLFGASTFSCSIDLYLSKESDYQVVAYTATQASRSDFESFNEKPIYPFERVHEYYPPSKYKMFVAVGYVKLNSVRKHFIEQALEKGYGLISHISPTATCWDDVQIGHNVFIFEGNIIQPHVKIGNGVILGRGNSIGHDSTIEDNVFIANRTVLCGNCHIGAESFIGSNATISDGVEIAQKNLIGASSLIRKDTQPEEVYIQEAAKKLNKKSSLFFR